MNKLSSLTMGVALAICFCCGLLLGPLVFNLSTHAQREARTPQPFIQKWEFQYINAQKHELVIEKTNRLGEDGWEIINAPSYDAQAGNYVVYLKRPKR